MYNKLNSCLSDFSHESEPGDYWYDCAILEATTILESFSDSDWMLLLNKLEGKSVFWKKRLVECLGDLNNQHEISVIFSVLDTDDEDLIIAGVDALRLLNLSTLDEQRKENLSLKAGFLLKKTSGPARKILEDFRSKLN